MPFKSFAKQNHLIGQEAHLSGKLRVGIMLDGHVVPNWMHSILSEIDASDHSELCLAIFNDSAKTKTTLWQKVCNLPQQVFAAYVLIDGKVFSRRVSQDAFAAKDASELLRAIPHLRITPLQGKFVDRFSEDDLDAIRTARLDVILRFGFRIIKGGILKTAKYGIWSFHHGDNDFYRGGPALFWEIYEDNPVSGSILQILNEDLDGGKVIYKSFASAHRYSLYMNRNSVYWKTARFVTRKLRALAENGSAGLGSIDSDRDACPKLYRTPVVPRTVSFALRCTTRLLAAQFRYRFFDEQWFLAIAKRTSPDSGAGHIPSHGPFEILKMPRSRFYADPCAISVHAQDFVFFEDYSFREKKGRISCATIDASGQIANISVVLEEPFHLSYPFVFELDGECFMIPESSAINAIRLYRATEFPTRWELETTLVPSVKAVDATLHRDGICWLFANLAQPGASNQDELHLFHASSLHGPWTPHRQNPIVSDVRRARPAGRLFLHNGMLLRPAQNNSARYGGSIVLNVVRELNQESYRETKLGEIEPEWLGDSISTHTLSITDRLVVTDGMRRPVKSIIAGW
jgi:hypothetical protein